jgi:hypothetical protein
MDPHGGPPLVDPLGDTLGTPLGGPPLRNHTCGTPLRATLVETLGDPLEGPPCRGQALGDLGGHHYWDSPSGNPLVVTRFGDPIRKPPLGSILSGPII